MDKKVYYVYGLIDPRNDQYFYIGKGKGKRFSSHLKPKRRDFNTAKLDKIKEIQEANLEVRIEILFPNLDEETAFELERIIIYKLGREVFNEGILTNLNPGGKWKPKDSVFYDENYRPSFDLSKLDFVSQEKFNEIPTISKFDYLNTSITKQSIYQYNSDGKFENEITLNDLFSEGVKGQDIAIFKAIRENELPVYSGWIFSKYFHEQLYVSEKIPFAEFDIIHEEFNRNFDKKYNESEIFNLECEVNGVVRMKVEREKDIIKLTSYYPSGKKRSLKKTKNGNPFEVAYEFYENGNLSVKENLKDAYYEYARTTYFQNGNEHIRISNYNGKKTYERWFENGIKEVEFIENVGYVYYNQLGNRIKVVPINYRTSYKENELLLDFTEKKELSDEMKKEKEQADIDWLKYENEINKTDE